MTFLATYDRRLEPGYVDGEARTVERDGTTFYDWPRPWGFSCDTCSRVFPYGCVALTDRQRLVPPTMREVGGGTHRCAYCEGYVEPDVQLDLFGAAA